MPDFQKAGPQFVRRIVNEMESQGYSVIEDFLCAEQLQAARAHVRYEVERHPHEYFAMQGRDALKGSICARCVRACTSTFSKRR